MQCGKERDKRAREEAWIFMDKKLAVCTKNYPEIGEFPAPIQKLLAQELDSAEERLEQRNFDGSLRCYCRYLLRVLIGLIFKFLI